MESPSSQPRMKARDLEDAALDLRRQGFSHAQIAVKLGCHHVTAYRRVKAALARLMATINEKAEEVRRLELERLDDLFVRLQPAIKGGDVKAILAALRVMERRSKLLGLDAPPPKQVVEIATPLSTDQLESVRDELLARLGEI